MALIKKIKENQDKEEKAAKEEEAAQPFAKHIKVFQGHIVSKKQAYDEAKGKLEEVKFAKRVDIDEKGQDLIDEEDLADYCESLAGILNGDEGMKSKLEAEIQAQRNVFQVGGTQLVKTDAIDAGGEGAFSMVQMACQWKGAEIEIRYIQKGRSWAMPEGETSPDLSIMVDYFQYGAVESLIAELNAGRPAPKKWKREEISYYGLSPP